MCGLLVSNDTISAYGSKTGWLSSRPSRNVNGQNCRSPRVCRRPLRSSISLSFTTSIPLLSLDSGQGSHFCFETACQELFYATDEDRCRHHGPSNCRFSDGFSRYGRICTSLHIYIKPPRYRERKRQRVCHIQLDPFRDATIWLVCSSQRPVILSCHCAQGEHILPWRF